MNATVAIADSSKYKMGRYKLRDLCAMNPEIWKHQRTLDKDRVNQLTKMLMENIKTRGELCIRNPIFLCQYHGKLYIIDGQHRYSALINIVNMGYYGDLYVYAMIIQCNTEEDMRFEFNNINNTTPVPKCFITPDQYINLAMGELKKHYPNFKETTGRVNRPNINVDDVKSLLIENNITKIFDLNVDKMVEAFYNLNNLYKNMTKDELRQKLYVNPNNKTFNNIYAKLISNGDMCYLGLFKSMHGYIWIEDMKKILSDATPLIKF
jgi:hypothetical protein